MPTHGDRRGGGPERAYAPDLPEPGGTVVLSPGESHHLVRVRRLRGGDAVVLFDGKGGSVVGTLVEAAGRAAEVRVDGAWPDREPERAVRLAVSLPEPGRADRLVGVLAEMGVAALAPLVAARTHPRRARMGEERRERWERLALEAAKVNGRSRLMRIEAPRTLAQVLREPSVLLDPDPAAPSLTSVLPPSGDLPWLLVGPEGGFTTEEVEQARRAGAPTARLARPVLRVENAALCAAALALASPPGRDGDPGP